VLALMLGLVSVPVLVWVLVPVSSMQELTAVEVVGRSVFEKVVAVAEAATVVQTEKEAWIRIASVWVVTVVFVSPVVGVASDCLQTSVSAAVAVEVVTPSWVVAHLDQEEEHQMAGIQALLTKLNVVLD